MMRADKIRFLIITALITAFDDNSVRCGKWKGAVFMQPNSSFETSWHQKLCQIMSLKAVQSNMETIFQVQFINNRIDANED